MELHHHTQLNTRPNSRRTLTQILTAAFGAQLVGLVFFASASQQPNLGQESKGLLTSSAASLVLSTFFTIVSFGVVLVFLAIGSSRKSKVAWVAKMYWLLRQAFAFLVVLVTFAVLAHLAIILPIVVIGPLI